jgi:hypothetical protein
VSFLQKAKRGRELMLAAERASKQRKINKVRMRTT